MSWSKEQQAEAKQYVLDLIEGMEEEGLDRENNRRHYRIVLDRIEQLEKKVAEYQARLEIDAVWKLDKVTGLMVRLEVPEEARDRMPDGISCRDSTIKMLEKLERRRFVPIAEFHAYKPLFYVGSNGTIDSCEVYKYKGNIPDYLQYFLPLDGIHNTVREHEKISQEESR